MNRDLATLVVLLALSLLAGVLAGCGAGASAPDAAAPAAPAAEDAPAAEVPPAEKVARLLDACGGARAFSGHHNVEYHYTLRLYGRGGAERAMTRQVHRFGLGSRPQAYVEDLDGDARQVVRLDGEALAVTRGGTRLTDPQALQFPRAFVGMARFTFLNPWNLLEAGSRLEGRGVRTPRSAGVVPSQPCDVVRLRFDRPAAAGGTDDWHDYYISRLSGLIEQVHSYRAQDNSYRVTIWSDYRSFEGLRIAVRRETHASDETGEIGDLEAVAEYSDVRFDAPFGEEIFQGEEAVAAAIPGA